MAETETTWYDRLEQEANARAKNAAKEAKERVQQAAEQARKDYTRTMTIKAAQMVISRLKAVSAASQRINSLSPGGKYRPPDLEKQTVTCNPVKLGVKPKAETGILPAGELTIKKERWFHLGAAQPHDEIITLDHSAWKPHSAQRAVINTVHDNMPLDMVSHFCQAMEQVANEIDLSLPDITTED